MVKDGGLCFVGERAAEFLAGMRMHGGPAVILR